MAIEKWARALHEEVLTSSAPDWLTSLLSQLRPALQAEAAIAYNPVPRNDHWDLEFGHWISRPEYADSKTRMSRYIRSCEADAPRFAAYDPYAVQLEQQNRAFATADLVALDPAASETHRRQQRAGGVDGLDQVRVLVCHGPRLLTWFGAVREKPFTPREVESFERLAAPLRQRLAAERVLGASMRLDAAVDALLGYVGRAALLFDRSGRLEFANAAGQQWIRSARSYPTGLEALRRAIVSVDGTHPEFSFVRTASSGMPGYVLAVATQSDASSALAVARATRRWALTSRKGMIVEELLEGRSNKEIAGRLGCAEVTVEKHLTELYRTIGVRSRAELCAKVRGS